MADACIPAEAWVVVGVTYKEGGREGGRREGERERGGWEGGRCVCTMCNKDVNTIAPGVHELPKAASLAVVLT